MPSENEIKSEHDCAAGSKAPFALLGVGNLKLPGSPGRPSLLFGCGHGKEIVRLYKSAENKLCNRALAHWHDASAV